MPLTQTERDALVEKFIARIPTERHAELHDQVMLDYDNFTDEGLQVLALGVDWVVWVGNENNDGLGHIDFGRFGYTTVSHEHDEATFECAEAFADILGLRTITWKK
jgi:hypothetical protein